MKEPSDKPHIFKFGTFWWCKGLHRFTRRSIMVHGIHAYDAWKRWHITRNFGEAS